MFDWLKKGFIGSFKVGEKEISCMVEYPMMNDECVIVVSSGENEDEVLVWKVMTGELVKKIVMKGVIEDGSRNEVKLMIRL